MVVKNGDESSGRIRTKITNKNKSKNILAQVKLDHLSENKQNENKVYNPLRCKKCKMIPEIMTWSQVSRCLL